MATPIHPSAAPAHHRASSPRAWRWARGALLVLLGLLLVLFLAVLFFPWDTLRGPLNHSVTEQTGRRFEITRRLDVHPGWRGVRVHLDGIEFANPAWARDPFLLKAERADFEVALWPLLLHRKLVLPNVTLASPQVGLQLEKDGRRTWALGKDTGDTGTVPTIGKVRVDAGTVDYLAPGQGLDLHAELSFDSMRGDLPLAYKVKGTYGREPVSAQGRAGDVLQIAAEGAPPFPFEIVAKGGQLTFKAVGTVSDLSTLDGLDARIDVRGLSLGNLYPIIGVVLPHTPPYALTGQLKRQGPLWQLDGLSGRLGLSDIAGDMRFETSGKRPLLSGALRSRTMDMDDLGPLLGMPPTERSAKAIEGVAAPASVEQVRKRQKGERARRVLPDAKLDFERLRAMDAEVAYTAEHVRNVRGVPLERGSLQLRLQAGVLTLDPLELGVAGGTIAGGVRIDGSMQPADIRASLNVRKLQINRMIPKVETLKTSFGRLDGRINLSGRGDSVATWLGAASGDVAAMTGRGQFSNLLLEYMGLDAGEVIKFWVRGDHNVTLRCAAVAFDVNQGAMDARTLVFDTTDTAFTATGQANLANETMSFVIRPEPKDKSILTARTPLLIRGSFGDPSVGVEATPLLARGAAALALGAINPLLALVATVETGPGEDADCGEVLAEARKPQSKNAQAGAAKAQAGRAPTAGVGK